MGGPSSVARSSKSHNDRIKTVKDDEFAQFLSSTDNLQFTCMLLLMRDGGLRVGEVLGLWLQDVEFHRNGLWIRRRHGLLNQALAKSLREGETICRSLAGDDVPFGSPHIEA